MTLTGTEAGYIALGAGALALVALVARAVELRAGCGASVRAQQALVAGESVDLVEFAVGMQTRMEQVEEIVGKAVERASRTQRKRTSTRPTSAARWSATTRSATSAATSRRPSRSSTRTGTGIVISAIQGRDYARLYVKDVVDGEAGSIDLTPEERQAVERAMA